MQECLDKSWVVSLLLMASHPDTRARAHLVVAIDHEGADALEEVPVGLGRHAHRRTVLVAQTLLEAARGRGEDVGGQKVEQDTHTLRSHIEMRST